MYALTLHQPWASAVFHGKDIENRNWPPPRWLLGKRLAIHAGKRFKRGEVIELLQRLENWWHGELPAADLLPLGVILGSVRIADVKTTNPIAGNDWSPWFVGPFGWVLEDARLYDRPIPMAGQQGLWIVEGLEE